MMHIHTMNGKPAVFSWVEGYFRKEEPTLTEEWSKNPEAVLERFDRLGKLDELEVLLDRGILH